MRMTDQIGIASIESENFRRAERSSVSSGEARMRGGTPALSACADYTDAVSTIRSLSQVSRRPLRKQPNHLWIPAFAGMTEGLCLPIWDRFD